MRTTPFSISIVIPTYNRAASLREMLSSLLQGKPSFLQEVVVVDDGSTDGTRSVAESFGAQVRYACTEQMGPAIARNEGVGHTSGSHVLFLDDDLVIPPDHLDHVRHVYESVECDWIVGGVIIAADLPDSSFIRYLKTSERLHSPMRPKMIESVLEGSMTAANLLVEKRSFLDLGGFTTDYRQAGCEDIDLGERALKAGIRIWHAPELSVDHRDANTLSFARFATRQYHGCIGHAEFYARFPHLRSQSALCAKVYPPSDPESPALRLRRGLQKMMATKFARQTLLWGALLAERAPVPDWVKWQFYRASISSHMMAGLSWGLRNADTAEKSNLL